MTDPKGGTWRFDYDAAGRRTRIEDPRGRTTALHYNAAGWLSKRVDAGGVVTEFGYDARGRVTTQAVAGEVTRYTYTPTGLLASVTLADGYRVDYQHDAAQRFVGASDNRGSQLSHVLDAAGNLLREEVRGSSGAIARVSTRIVNSLNQLTEWRGAAGQATQVSYDANGRPVSQTDPLNQTTRQVLDALGRETTLVLPDDKVVQTAWNGLDQIERLIDPKGVATAYTRNVFGEVVAEHSPDIGTITYERDEAGGVRSMTDAKGQVTSIERDALGQVAAWRYADGSGVTLARDVAGHVREMRDRSGGTLYERDPQGRVLEKVQTVADSASFPTRLQVRYSLRAGRLDAVTYPSGLSVAYQRDGSGRVVGILAQEPGGTARRPKAVLPLLAEIAYTPLGQPNSWAWNNGDRAWRTFDLDGRMTSNEFAQYVYDAAGQLTGVSQTLWARAAAGSEAEVAAPLSWTVGYDARGRVVAFERPGSSARYQYDPNGNRLMAEEHTIGDSDLDGTYEATDFARSEVQAAAIEAASNRLLGLTLTSTLQPRGEGGPSRTSSRTVTYGLDANGSLIHDGLRAFGYGADGRLAAVRFSKDGEAVTVRYLVNGLGQRVFKGQPIPEVTEPDPAVLGEGFVEWLRRQFGSLFGGSGLQSSLGTSYVYGDGELPPWAMLGEYDNGSGSGRGRTEYIWLPLEDGNAIPVAFWRGGEFHSVHTDHLGTPRVVKDARQRVVWQWPYSAFGQNKPTGLLRTTANPRAAMTNEPALLRVTAAKEFNLRFPGQYFDEETGAMQNYMRDYDASFGRYRQSDPFGLEAGPNRYLYSEASPFNLFDPDGLTVKNPKLYPLSEQVMESLLRFNEYIGCDKDIVVTGGDRRLDSKLGAKGTSTHVSRLAADIRVPGQSHLLTANQARASGIFRGIGWYEEGFLGPSGEGPHVHVDLRPGPMAQWGHEASGKYHRGSFPYVDIEPFQGKKGCVCERSGTP